MYVCRNISDPLPTTNEPLIHITSIGIDGVHCSAAAATAAPVAAAVK